METKQITSCRINVSPTSVRLCYTDGVSGGTYASVPNMGDEDAQIAEFKATAAKRWPGAKVVVRQMPY